MKNEFFGNVLEESVEDLTGNNTEFYKASDKFSARTLNRPIRTTYEDLENIYMVMQNICKTLYGQKENGILPDMYEEMNEETIIEGHFFNKPETFIRIPTGAFFAKLDDEQAKYYSSSYEESNQYSRDFYIDNDRSAAVIINRPNSELFERQLGEHFNFDLNDQDEDIKLNYECYTETAKQINVETENDQYTDLENKFSRKQKIRYYLTFKKTQYDYYNKEKESSKIITSTINTSRVPINKENYCSNVFDLVSDVNSIYGNYLTKEDNDFSLEELIPIKTEQSSTEWKDGQYIIFFNPFTKTVENSDYVRYSRTKRFGICPASSISDIFGNNEFQIIKLFEISLVFDFDVSNVRRCTVTSQNNFLSKIDRTTLDIKNLNLTNGLNGLIIEKVKQTDNKDGNINIGEAHINKEPDTTNETIGSLGFRNISIGLKNLGYPAIKGVDQDPTINSQRYKENIGNDNISIGTNAMRNTAYSKTNGYAEKNIAIGTNTLVNIGTGKRNIEIGTGNGNINNSNGNINIGNNLTSMGIKLSLGDDNIMLGYKNAYNTSTIANKNVIIGNENNNDSNEFTIENENFILGKNKIKTLKSKNTIIGNNVSDNGITADNNNTIIGINNSSGSIKENNYIIGYNNCGGYLGSNNVIIGNENINEIHGIENSNNNYIFGNKNNSFANSGFIIGTSNLLNENSADNYIVGAENSVNDNNNITVGYNNSIFNTNNKTFGNSNNISNNNNVTVGNDNIVSSSNNKTFGNSNNISGENSFVVSNNQKLENNNSVIVGCFNTTEIGNITSDNQTIIGPLNGMNFCYTGLYNSETGIAASAIKVDGTTGELNLFFKNSEFVGNNTTFNGNIISKTGTIKAERYISQSILGKNMFVNGFTEHEINKYDGDESEMPDVNSYNIGIPVSGSLYVANLPDSPKNKITNYKSFIGSITKEDSAINKSAIDFISIRENNGGGSASGKCSKDGSIIYLNRASGRLSSSVQNNEIWDEDREYLDNTGNQSIKHTMSFLEGLTVPKSDNIINTKFYNGFETRGNVEFNKNTSDDKFISDIPVEFNKTFKIIDTSKNEAFIFDNDKNITINVNKLIGTFEDDITINAANSINEISESYINLAAANDINIASETSTTMHGLTKVELNTGSNDSDIVLSSLILDGNNIETNSSSFKAVATSNITLSSNSEISVHSNSATTIVANGKTTTFGGTSGSSTYCFTTNGAAKIGGDITATSFIAISARDQKKNIVPTKYNAVEEINKVEIVDFNFKTDTNNEDAKIGFIADDTDKIFSTKTKDKMDLYNCVGMLMKAVQELSAENKELKERILKLEK